MRDFVILISGLGALLLARPKPEAKATLRDSAGKELGTLALAETARGIQLTGTLNGLPDGDHAIHIHTVGRCGPTFEAAGEHWNPTNRDHGRHFGDLPNVTVREGKAEVNGTTPGGTVRGEQALLDADGSAVIVHANPDDYQTQPSGNAGGRIACGVVGTD
jgi:Cu-Zn family superoxide dismutase